MALAVPRTWVVGEVVTAAMQNAEIRDQFNDLIAGGTAYSPSWTASTTNPVLNAGATLTGRYKLLGKMCDATIKLTAGASTTYGTGVWSFSLPFTASSNGDWIAKAFAGDASVGTAGYSQGTAFIAGGTTVQAYFGNNGGSSGASSTVPQTWASGDRLWITIRYETA